MIDFRTAGIGAVVYYVRDLKRTAAFYRDTLGLDVQPLSGKASDAADAPLMAKTGETLLLFFQHEETRGGSPVIVFRLSDGGIDDVYERLLEKQVIFVCPVGPAPGGFTTDFLDPDEER
ncbi:MAG: VOC family protein, partial [Planctomycetota bacterium]